MDEIWKSRKGRRSLVGKLFGMDTSWKGIRKGLGGIKKNMKAGYSVPSKARGRKRSKRRLY